MHNIALSRIRHLVQLAMVAVLGKWAFYGIFRCPFLVPFVNCQNCPVITCWGRLTAYFMGAWLLIPLSVLIAGRTFCGWLCPTGFVSQLLGKFSLFPLKLKKKYIRLGQIGMVLTVAAAAIIYFGYGNPRMMVPIRAGEFFGSLPFVFEHASWIWLFRTALIITLIVGSIIVANVWCRFFCPAGGIMEVVRRISPFGVFKTKACDGCNACRRVCGMGTRPGEANCINCGDCLHVCHKQAIYAGKRGRK
ncbi:4Fe-4S binding protein [uncultured Megasphaera sp.]|uniref:4Fe-4S binding protein n=1 Tax=uncultured Megasphaera sp. TaxID=165188 RepID=UPI0026599EF0|nr:4Fe-4S binding protein [uncultured Megasphaera sp.]